MIDHSIEMDGLIHAIQHMEIHHRGHTSKGTPPKGMPKLPSRPPFLVKYFSKQLFLRDVPVKDCVHFIDLMVQAIDKKNNGDETNPRNWNADEGKILVLIEQTCEELVRHEEHAAMRFALIRAAESLFAALDMLITESNRM
jgi:hypothetical protein